MKYLSKVKKQHVLDALKDDYGINSDLFLYDAVLLGSAGNMHSANKILNSACIKANSFKKSKSIKFDLNEGIELLREYEFTVLSVDNDFIKEFDGPDFKMLKRLFHKDVRECFSQHLFSPLIDDDIKGNGLKKVVGKNQFIYEKVNLGLLYDFSLEVIEEFGGVEVAKKILHSNRLTEEFVDCWKDDLLHKTVEAKVSKPVYSHLFTKEEISVAKRRVEEAGKLTHNTSPDITAAHTLKESEEAYAEGDTLLKTHKIKERDSRVIKHSKESFKKNNGTLICEACGFDFEKVYGKRGKDFIEAHHNNLVSKMKEGDKTRIEDITMLCSNCHRMIHKKPMMTLKQLRDLLNTN
ncbi:HNH endonuclease [Halobacillus sp. H74]|uniref:HNH endonuclease n=1 Tax=Halobacillus sp. H74 TaxID=3457436 RepID=UPI003FCD682B